MAAAPMADDNRRIPRIDRRRFRRADGTFRDCWSVRYYDPRGINRRVACQSELEAEKFRAKLLTEAGWPGARSASPFSHGPSMTLGEFWLLWLRDARDRLAEGTIWHYELSWRLRIEPVFGAYPVRSIRPHDIAEWRSDMLDDGVGDEAVRHAMCALQGLYRIAAEWGEADLNPVALVKKPRQGRKKAIELLPPLGVERVRAQLIAGGDLRSATMVSVMAYSGLRPGELLGLEWRHIRQATILIEQAVGGTKLKLPKNGRVGRTIDLLEPLAADLQRWRRSTGGEGFVFAKRDSTHMTNADWAAWRTGKFHPAANRAGLGKPRPYDLRHFFVSLLVREQLSSVVEIADQLGHAPTQTHNTYAHVFSEYRRTPPRDLNEWILENRRKAEREVGSPRRKPRRLRDAHDGG
jgi:integrase